MSENTKIEWCDHTFNPWIGCAKVSPGCANCYAEREDDRFGWTPEGWGKGKPRKRTSVANWVKVEKWNRIAGADLLAASHILRDEKAGDHNVAWAKAVHRPRVFVASLSDWLDPEVPIEWLADLLDLVRRCPHVDFLMLTKRLELFFSRLEKAHHFVFHNWSHYRDQPRGEASAWMANWLHGWQPANVWIGTSVEDQQRAEERIPALLKIPARVRFLSCEPLLGPVDAFVLRNSGIGHVHVAKNIHWVICGGESGSYARPMHPDWARSLRDQCQAAGVPFLFKQWGEHDHCGKRVGKAKAGRMLNGREWNQFPEGGAK